MLIEYFYKENMRVEMRLMNIKCKRDNLIGINSTYNRYLISVINKFNTLFHPLVFLFPLLSSIVNLIL